MILKIICGFVSGKDKIRQSGLGVVNGNEHIASHRDSVNEAWNTNQSYNPGSEKSCAGMFWNIAKRFLKCGSLWTDRVCSTLQELGNGPWSGDN